MLHKSLTSHVVVAMGQEVGQCSLGFGVHVACLGQMGVALEVGDGGDRLRAHDAVYGADVVVELSQVTLQLRHRRRTDGRRFGHVDRNRVGAALAESAKAPKDRAAAVVIF